MSTSKRQKKNKLFTIKTILLVKQPKSHFLPFFHDKLSFISFAFFLMKEMGFHSLINKMSEHVSIV